MKRARRHDRVFLAAIAVSTLIHLSMVTVFRIVIYFPAPQIDYFQFQVVQPRAAAAVTARPDELALSPGGAFGAEDGLDAYSRSLPPVDVRLPTLGFAELELLRTRTRSLEVRNRYQELFDSGPTDSWAAFGKQLGSFSDLLSRITRGAPDPAADKQPVSRPAPGFAAYVEWSTPPVNRLPITVAKIEALRGRAPEFLREPISLSFEVARDGRVTKVFPLSEEHEGVVESAAAALFQFRFEPVGEDAPEPQQGAFIVTAEPRAR